MRSIIALLALFTSGIIVEAKAEPTVQPKEWTLLLFLNGNNNLDSFGALNLNQIEKIGSTDKINVVVQWASLENGKTQRLYMKKDNDTEKVTSPVIEDMGQVDMGDYQSVIDFVKWGSEKYPAKHYMLDLWDHGSGWHFKKQGGVLKDISWDEISGNHITTEQLATALTQSAKIIGHKIDLYASDACLMAMVEIAAQMEDSVDVFAGSEEVEPGEGWPYDTFLASWNKLPKGGNAREVAKVLSEEYAKSYETSGRDVTFSAFDMNFLAPMNAAIRTFSDSFRKLNNSELAKVKTAVEKSTRFSSDDYVDFLDFIKNLKAQKIAKLGKTTISDVSNSTEQFIVANNTVGFPNAHGMSIWIPTDSYTYSQYADRYSRLKFDNATRWGDVAKAIANAD